MAPKRGPGRDGKHTRQHRDLLRELGARRLEPLPFLPGQAEGITQPDGLPPSGQGDPVFYVADRRDAQGRSLGQFLLRQSSPLAQLP